MSYVYSRTVAVAATPTDIAAVDLQGDGLQDLVVLGRTVNSMTIH